MPKLFDVIDETELVAAIEAGYVQTKRHERLPYTLLGYSHTVDYDNAWNETIKACRGLIYNHETMEIVCLPFPKFMNYEQLTEPLPEGDFYVNLKLDGSLGILVPVEDGKYEIATRGSFTSDQAIEGTKIWNELYADKVKPYPGHTYLFEIIYDENRIVVDYEGERDLILLAVIVNEDGSDTGHLDWPGQSAHSFSDPANGEVLPNIEAVLDYRNNTRLTGDQAEGFVITIVPPQGGVSFRCKVKLADYIRLHRIVTGCTSVTIWEHLRDGHPLSELTSNVPDEFYAWVQEIVAELRTEHENISMQAALEFDRLYDDDRKSFALSVLGNKYQPLLFAMYDGKDISSMVWKMIKPERTLPFFNIKDENE